MNSKYKNHLIILILGALTTISPFSIDMYLPAFQNIADHLGSTTAQVSLSLSSYFVGLALGQVFYGPFLDRFGRKKPIYFGLVLYVLASFFCLLSTGVNGLIMARFFQALGGCAASVGSTAMVRDFFSPEEGAKVFSKLMLILSVSPLFAPTVGGWIVSQWGWHAIFLVLAVITSLFLVIVFFWLPEGHHPDPTVSLKLGPILKIFAFIFKDPRFFAFAVSGAFSFAGLFTYLAGAPSIFFRTFHLSTKTFGLIFAFLSLGMIGGGQVNIFLMKYFSSEQIYKTALRGQMLVAFIFAVGAAMNWYGLSAHILILFIYIACVGLTYPNAAALALVRFHKNAGSAAALLGTIQMGVGALASAAFGLLKFQPSLSVAVVFVLTSLLGLSIFQLSVGKADLPANEKEPSREKLFED
jgi:DHA1 family bicyclomycin/chloramphenicol resistance-like MFS transporter